MRRFTVACVLRSGGPVYSPEWVAKLSRGVARWMGERHRFVCLSDVPVPCERIPLRDARPGWYSKIELFRPGQFEGTVLYLDLDTLVVDTLRPILDVAAGPLAMLSDFYRPAIPASGVMAWTAGDPSVLDVWEGLSSTTAHNPRARLDYEIAKHVEPRRLQSLAPGAIVSLKAHARSAIPGGAALVCGHGRPRFSDARAGWAHRHWSEQ